jgi:hypothetical protein
MKFISKVLHDIYRLAVILYVKSEVTASYVCKSHQTIDLTKTGKERKRTQLEYRTALAQQMIGQYRGIRKRKPPAVTGICGLAHYFYSERLSRSYVWCCYLKSNIKLTI